MDISVDRVGDVSVGRHPHLEDCLAGRRWSLVSRTDPTWRDCRRDGGRAARQCSC